MYSPERPPHTQPIPITKVSDRVGTTYIKCDPAKVVAVVESNIPDNGRTVSPVDDEFRSMANNLIGFLHSEVEHGRLCNPLPPVQAGVGSVSNAVLQGLAESDFEHLTELDFRPHRRWQGGFRLRYFPHDFVGQAR